MNTPNEALHEKLRALEAIFLQKLPGKCEEIVSALENLASSPDDTGLQHDLHRYLHTMAGSAGTFGFEALGRQARVYESRLKPWVKDGVMPAQEFEQFRQQLRQYMQAVIAGDIPDAVPQPEDASDILQPQEPVHENRLIYLVDQDAEQQQAISSQLEHFGFEVVWIAHPRELARAVGTRRPDAIVIELSFPDDQHAGAEEIRRLEQLQRFRIPTIFISSSPTFASRMLAVRAHGDGYFTKPVDVVGLTDRIEALLRRESHTGYRVMIIDDDVVTARYYSMVLRNAGMEVHLLHDPAQVLAAISDFRPELILMDIYMPVCSGIELSKLIRQDNSYVDIPIVFLSSEVDPERQLDAVRAGADDFIAKPVRAEYLVSSVVSRAERYRTLRALIMRDGLTGLLNHSAIKERLQSEMLQAKRNSSPLALAMIDLDSFKKINDSYGHATGDQVLRTLARLLQQRLRRTDIVGRYGGEEFAVIFPDTSAVKARTVLDEVRQAFGRISQHAENGSFHVTFSAGIADLGQASDADALFEVADAAMYVSKQTGRNRITLA
ncbi:diguanylate cyclase [Undibacterium luofuense]|uniref:diguanylate cyclase n=1 Tax=Undibacterium luofuense TaxID=2828733 RepID=UPI0030EC4151